MYTYGLPCKGPPIFIGILPRRASCPFPSPTTPRRQYHGTATSVSTAAHAVTDVAILGGGITGLASAYYLSQQQPNSRITLFEGSSRMGGWLHSKRVDVGSGNIVFEQGPRSLRANTPNSLVTLDLISKLNLSSRLLISHKSSLAARNRYVYYPDHLVKMPGPGVSILRNFYNVMTEPVFNGWFKSMFRDFSAPCRSENLFDESIGSFITRRSGTSVLVDNLVSAIFHGIYAGDIYQLSTRSVLPGLWRLEEQYGSIIKGIDLRRGKSSILVPKEDVEISTIPFASGIRGWSVFTFVGGIMDLVDALLNKLQKCPNVKIRKNTEVKHLKLRKRSSGSMIEIASSSKESLAADTKYELFSHTISTVSGATLDRIAVLPPLSRTPSVTVMVVNLYFSNPELLPVRGFGYLIPRSVPFTENPEFALGVIFDSDVSASLSTSQDTVDGTKVTVMLGGHWWTGWEAYPDEDEGASMAKAVLKRHLGINEEPKAINVSLQKNCIPQYTVGHDARMEETSLLLEKFEGRLRVAGNSYTGVGLHDCVRAAQAVVTGLVNGKGKTGLESFVGGRQWVWFDHPVIR